MLQNNGNYMHLINNSNDFTFSEEWYRNRGFNSSNPPEIYQAVKEFIELAHEYPSSYWQSHQIYFASGHVTIVKEGGDVPYVISTVFARALQTPEIPYQERALIMKGLTTIFRESGITFEKDLSDIEYPEPTLPIKLVNEENTIEELVEVPLSFWTNLPYFQISLNNSGYGENPLKEPITITLTEEEISDTLHFFWFIKHRITDRIQKTTTEYTLEIPESLRILFNENAASLLEDTPQLIFTNEKYCTIPAGSPMYIVRNLLPEFRDILVNPLCILVIADYFTDNLSKFNRCVRECLKIIRDEIIESPLSLDDMRTILTSLPLTVAPLVSDPLFEVYIQSALKEGISIEIIENRLSGLVEEIFPPGYNIHLTLHDLKNEDIEAIGSWKFIDLATISNSKSTPTQLAASPQSRSLPLYLLSSLVAILAIFYLFNKGEKSDS